MKHLRITILILASLLIVNPVVAIELPLLNINGGSQVVFADKTHEKILKPLLEELLKNNRQNRKAVSVDINVNKEARQDKDSIERMLRSEGFYAAKVSYEIEGDKISFKVSPEKPYLLEEISIESSLKNLPNPKQLGLKKGQRFRAEDVLSAQTELSSYLEKNYCLWEIKVNYDATVNHQDKKASVAFIVEDSEEVKFSDISFSGMETIKEQYLKNRIGL